MKLKSISALLFQVSDLKRTAQFYQDLGFHLEKNEADFVMVRINWFTVEFYRGQPAAGTGQLVLVSVEDVDQLYEHLQGRGIKTEGQPKDGQNGRYELLVRDPDGYQLVFFQKK